MKTRTLAALVLLATACTTADKLIITNDDASPTSDAAASGGSGPGGTGGQGEGAPADAALTPDAPATPDAPVADLGMPPDAVSFGDATAALSCAELPACGAGTECLCCPLGLRVEHCTCSVPCQADSECPASAPHCNVRKVMGVPLGKGFCTPTAFPCVW